MSGDLPPASGPEAADHADLGLPVPWNRPWRRLITRLVWPVLRRQIDVNHWTHEELADVRAQVADVQVRLQDVTETVADVQVRLQDVTETVSGRVEQLNEAQRTLERFESTLETVGEILGRHDKAIGNAQEQSFARQVASDGVIRREMGELALELNDFRSTYAMSMASILPKLAAAELAFDQRPMPGPVTKERSKSREILTPFPISARSMSPLPKRSADQSWSSGTVCGSTCRTSSPLGLSGRSSTSAVVEASSFRCSSRRE